MRRGRRKILECVLFKSVRRNIAFILVWIIAMHISGIRPLFLLFSHSSHSLIWCQDSSEFIAGNRQQN